MKQFTGNMLMIAVASLVLAASAGMPAEAAVLPDDAVLDGTAGDDEGGLTWVSEDGESEDIPPDADAVFVGEGEGEAVNRIVVVEDDDSKDPHVYRWSGRMAERGYLGVHLMSLTPELQKHFGVPEGTGVMISRVEADSPAAEAGLKAGDILTAVDGQTVKSSHDIQKAIWERKEGDLLLLDVVREGRVQSFTVAVGKREFKEFDVGSIIAPEILEDIYIMGPELENMTLHWQKMGEELGKDLTEYFESDEWKEQVENWKTLSQDGANAIILKSDELGKSLEELEAYFKSPEWQEKMEEMKARESELEERLKELEKRLKELEKDL